MKLQNNLGEILAGLGYSQADLHHLLEMKVKETMISRYCANKTQPLTTYRLICKKLKLDVDDLFYMVDDQGKKYALHPLKKRG